MPTIPFRRRAQVARVGHILRELEFLGHPEIAADLRAALHEAGALMPRPVHRHERHRFLRARLRNLAWRAA